MAGGIPELSAARNLTDELAAALQAAPAFRALAPETQTALVRDVSRLRGALSDGSDPYALTLETTAGLRRRIGDPGTATPPTAGNGGAGGGATVPPPRPAATETLAARAGALADEIDFPAFVAGLVHGTFDAIVDSTIRQMEAFAELVSALSRDAEDFTRDNISANQARDWLVQQHPQDLALEVPASAGGGEPQVKARQQDEAAEPPGWLSEFGIDDEPLSDELIEEQLVPAARRTLGERRLKTLATMVLLGMNRVVVRDGRIAARVRFRATARDSLAVDYAASQDRGGGSWGKRGSSTYDNSQTMVSTVGVNAQSDADLKVELFGQVELNFASDALPLERFADSASVALLERHARGGAPASAPAADAPVAPVPTDSTPAPGAPLTPGTPDGPAA